MGITQQCTYEFHFKNFIKNIHFYGNLCHLLLCVQNSHFLSLPAFIAIGIHRQDKQKVLVDIDAFCAILWYTCPVIVATYFCCYTYSTVKRAASRKVVR